MKRQQKHEDSEPRRIRDHRQKIESKKTGETSGKQEGDEWIKK